MHSIMYLNVASDVMVTLVTYHTSGIVITVIQEIIVFFITLDDINLLEEVVLARVGHFFFFFSPWLERREKWNTY